MAYISWIPSQMLCPVQVYNGMLILSSPYQSLVGLKSNSMFIKSTSRDNSHSVIKRIVAIISSR